MLVQARLDQLFGAIARSKNAEDFYNSVSANFSPRDRAFAKKSIKALKWPIKINRLNRGYAIELNNTKLTVSVESVTRRKYRFNDKVDWTYSPDNPLEIQLEVVARGLENKSASGFNPFFAEANAGFLSELAKLCAAAAVFSGFVTPYLTEWTLKWYRPSKVEEYCTSIERDVSYKDAEYCKDYYKWLDGIRAAKVTLPQAKPVDPQKAKSKEAVKLSNTCAPKAKDTKEMVIFAEGDATVDKKIVRMKAQYTITFDKENKAIRLDHQVLQPVQGPVKTYEFKPKAEGSELVTISDTAGLFLSRDPKYQDRMTPKKLKLIDEEEAVVIPEIKSFIQKCNKDAEEPMETASTSSPLLQVDEIKKTDPEVLRRKIEADAQGAK